VVVIESSPVSAQPPVEVAAGALHRRNGVAEVGRVGVLGDRLDFHEVRRHAGLERRHEMLRADAVERHRAEGRRPFGLQEGVGLQVGGRGGGVAGLHRRAGRQGKQQGGRECGGEGRLGHGRHQGWCKAAKVRLRIRSTCIAFNA
jgi:hypothetical protein